MKRTILIAVLVGLAAIVASSSHADARYNAGMNVYPGVTTPMPPRPVMSPVAGMPMSRRTPTPMAPMVPIPLRMRMKTASPSPVNVDRPHVGANVYPSVRTPMPQFADGPNLYQYVRSNPIRHTDSSGLAVDPGNDCGLWSRSNKGRFIGPIKKPTHLWLNSDSGKLWDFGPNYDWLRAHYDNPPPPEPPEYGDCTIFKYCRGEANWGGDAYAHRTGDVNKRPKLQLIGKLWFGRSKGTSCRCATCAGIESCLSEVRGRWDGTRYDHFARHCGSFVLDAAAWCCLWGM